MPGRLPWREDMASHMRVPRPARSQASQKCDTIHPPLGEVWEVQHVARPSPGHPRRDPIESRGADLERAACRFELRRTSSQKSNDLAHASLPSGHYDLGYYLGGTS
jgi:hypothetical protein